MSSLPQPPAGFMDAQGGQPLAPGTVAAWQVAAERGWADPGRLHHPGRQAGVLLDAARASLSNAFGVRASDLFFTGSGTAALMAALNGTLRSGCRLVFSAIDSLAVFDRADQWLTAGGTVTELPVDSLGRVDPADLARALEAGDAAAVCLQVANPEIGTCQPVAEVHQIAQAAGVPLIVDATGAVGHLPIPPHWDLLAADARDWAGPAGVGVLVVRPGTRWHAPYGSARGWLGGSGDIPSAVAAATALEIIGPHVHDQAAIHRAMIDRLRAGIGAGISDVDIVGDPNDRLPHVLTFSVLYARGEALVTELDRRGFNVASGSACVVDADRASHVLAAIGAFTGGNVRITLPYNCSEQMINDFLAVLPDVVAMVREEI